MNRLSPGLGPIRLGQLAGFGAGPSIAGLVVDFAIMSGRHSRAASSFARQIVRDRLRGG
jgi:hypothetical protein